MEAIHIQATVEKDGILAIPELKKGERVEVIVKRKSKSAKPKFAGGWAKGKVHILPGFDDPIPGMEEYM